MSRPRTIVVTGSASGMGAATARRLVAAGHRVIGVDQRDATVVADLGSAGGRADAVAQVTDLAGGADGAVDGLVTWAGLGGLTGRPGSLLAAVNYFGTIAMLEGLRPLLARGEQPAAVAISSNSTLVQPGVPLHVVEACLSGDEDVALAAAEAAGSFTTYAATKTALAWWVRRHAPGGEWAGAGITLNVVAPGAVETPLLQQTREDPTVGGFIDTFPIPVGRKGTADELAAFVEFLLGPDARFFCGSFLVVDGGTDAHLRPDDTPVPWNPQA
ncbi:SDR family oxidoreductase [Aquihabitans daechungensis]|uniref:SDR family oxidoreductase n=1 Tax=Aquihabitans daechungensis TaxID=1052257 RepID=UPI003B9FA810